MKLCTCLCITYEYCSSIMYAYYMAARYSELECSEHSICYYTVLITWGIFTRLILLCYSGICMNLIQSSAFEAFFGVKIRV